MKLNDILNRTKKTMIDSYCGSVGSFYEEYGYSEAGAEMAESLSNGIDQRISQYEEHLQQSESYAALHHTTARWLQQDDGYMAARLRDDMKAYGSMSAQMDETAYTLWDLEIAGIYSAECREELDNQGGTFWSDNEQRIGLNLAVQGMKTDYLGKHAGLSKAMQNLLQDTFQNYKNDYVDALEKFLKEKAKRFFTPFKTSVQREEIDEVYYYTMMQYRQSGNILDAFTKGAKKAENRNGSGKYDWNNFFDNSNYTRYMKKDSMYVKYQKSIHRFLESLESGNDKKVHLLFGSSGDDELNLLV